MSEQEKPAYLAVTESGMKNALIEARGDIFIASQMLGITAIRLNRAIQVSAVLQATVAAIPEATDDATTKQIHAAIESRLALYRVVGLDALADLAAIDVNDPNSAKLQVKLAAAARLAGSPEASGAGGDLAEALRELNGLYQANAPRLRVIRERLTVEVGSPDTPPLGDIVSTQQG